MMSLVNWCSNSNSLDWSDNRPANQPFRWTPEIKKEELGKLTIRAVEQEARIESVLITKNGSTRKISLEGINLSSIDKDKHIEELKKTFGIKLYINFNKIGIEEGKVWNEKAKNDPTTKALLSKCAAMAETGRPKHSSSSSTSSASSTFSIPPAPAQEAVNPVMQSHPTSSLTSALTSSIPPATGVASSIPRSSFSSSSASLNAPRRPLPSCLEYLSEKEEIKLHALEEALPAGEFEIKWLKELNRARIFLHEGGFYEENGSSFKYSKYFFFVLLNRVPLDLMISYFQDNTYILSDFLGEFIFGSSKRYLDSSVYATVLERLPLENLKALLTPGVVASLMNYGQSSCRNSDILNHLARIEGAIDQEKVLTILKSRNNEGLMLFECLPHTELNGFVSPAPRYETFILNLCKSLIDEPLIDGLSLVQRNAIVANEAWLWEPRKTCFTLTEVEFWQKGLEIRQLMLNIDELLFQEIDRALDNSELSTITNNELCEDNNSPPPNVGSPAHFTNRGKSFAKWRKHFKELIEDTTSQSRNPTRLEDKNKLYGEKIVILEETLRLMEFGLRTRERLDISSKNVALNYLIFVRSLFFETQALFRNLSTQISIQELTDIYNFRNSLNTRISPLSGLHPDLETKIFITNKMNAAENNQIDREGKGQVQNQTKRNAKIIAGVFNRVLRSAIHSDYSLHQQPYAKERLEYLTGLRGFSNEKTPYSDDRFKELLLEIWCKKGFSQELFKTGVFHISEALSRLDQEVLIQWFQDNIISEREAILAQYFRRLPTPNLDTDEASDSSSSTTSSSSSSSSSTSSSSSSSFGQGYRLNGEGVLYILKHFGIIKP